QVRQTAGTELDDPFAPVAKPTTTVVQASPAPNEDPFASIVKQAEGSSSVPSTGLSSQRPDPLLDPQTYTRPSLAGKSNTRKPLIAKDSSSESLGDAIAKANAQTRQTK